MGVVRKSKRGKSNMSSTSSSSASTSSPATTNLSRYESQKRRDWNTFGQFLRDHKPPLTLSGCTSAHVLEFMRDLDRFGKTKVHTQDCSLFGHPNPTTDCTCPLRQAWGSLDALIGRLRAAYEENGGRPESNPFGARAVGFYLRELRDCQARARGLSYEKKKRKRPPDEPPASTPPPPTGSQPQLQLEKPPTTPPPSQPELDEMKNGSKEAKPSATSPPPPAESQPQLPPEKPSITPPELNKKNGLKEAKPSATTPPPPSGPQPQLQPEKPQTKPLPSPPEKPPEKPPTTLPRSPPPGLDEMKKGLKEAKVEKDAVAVKVSEIQCGISHDSKPVYEEISNQSQVLDIGLSKVQESDEMKEGLKELEEAKVEKESVAVKDGV